MVVTVVFHEVTSHGEQEGSGRSCTGGNHVGCGWSHRFAVGQDLVLIQQTLTQGLWKHHSPGWWTRFVLEKGMTGCREIGNKTMLWPRLKDTKGLEQQQIDVTGHRVETDRIQNEELNYRNVGREVGMNHEWGKGVLCWPISDKWLWMNTGHANEKKSTMVADGKGEYLFHRKTL